MLQNLASADDNLFLSGDKVQLKMVEDGVVHKLLIAMNRYPKDFWLQHHGGYTIHNLASSCCKSIVKARALPIILSMMRLSAKPQRGLLFGCVCP